MEGNVINLGRDFFRQKAEERTTDRGVRFHNSVYEVEARLITYEPFYGELQIFLQEDNLDNETRKRIYQISKDLKELIKVENAKLKIPATKTAKEYCLSKKLNSDEGGTSI
ncbi:MAG: hypothetical protein PVJ67_00855 [Candidatus Pacearchaeota archaeon]|jgi:hypothetical protein